MPNSARPQSSPLKFRAVGPVIRAAGLAPWTAVFFLLFVLASVLVAQFEPNVGGIANAIWLMFQVVTTIGLGDFTCTSIVGRIAVIVLSLYSLLYVALITGAVVSYCGERMSAHRNESAAQFIDQLEHLPELSPEELEELSKQVREFSKKHLG